MNKAIEGRSGCKRWILQYTCMYLVIFVPMIICLLVSGKTFLWGADAYEQQYTTLSYTGSVLRGLFSGEGFSMLDLSLGQGMDTIGTLAYYGLTDPLQWIGALFTGKALEAYYHFLIFLYIYLAGLFFGVYVCKHIIPGKSSIFVALSAIIYTCSGYQTIGVIKNPYYAAGGIYLVLMLLAVERILQNRRWLMMTLITLLMLMANFYLAYQTTLLVILYILVRLAFRLKTRGVKKSAGDGFMLMGAYLLGLALSMAFLLPSAINFINSGRVDVASGYTDSLLHYPSAYYLKLAALFSAPYDYAGYWALQSFCPLALFAVILLFAPGKRGELIESNVGKRQLRMGFLVLLICLCVPLAGKLFNGMGYATNRWSYGYAVMVCMVTAWALPKMLDPDFKGRKKLAIVGLIWAAGMLAYGVIAHRLPVFSGGSNIAPVGEYGVGTKNVAACAGAVALAASALCLWALDRKLCIQRKKAMRIVAGLTTLCCFAYSIGYAVVAATTSEFMDSNIEYQIENRTAAAAGDIQDEGFYRVDTGNGTNNHASLLDYNGTTYYWSMIPEWVSRHYTGLQLSTQRWIFRLEGLGADTYLNTLASVKYAVRPEGELQGSLPYGYEFADTIQQEDGDIIEVYENQYALPLGYVFDEVMSQEQYDQLSPLEKRRALISCAVLEDADCGLENYAGSAEIEKLNWEVVSAEGVELDGNELRSKAGGLITLRFDARSDTETYLHLTGTDLLSVDDDTDLRIDCNTQDGTGRMYVILPDGNFNYNQQGVCLRLGYSATGLVECTLRFHSQAVLRFDKLEILSVPMQGYRDAIDAIDRRGSWDVKPESDRIAGDLILEEPGVLQLSIPYSRGWKAYVDGEEAQVLRSGGMYMGLRLDAGTHQIEFLYETPGLRAGALISLAGVLTCLGLVLLQCKRRNIS